MFLYAVTISYLGRMLVDSSNIDLPNVNLPPCVYNELKMQFFLVNTQLY